MTRSGTSQPLQPDTCSTREAGRMLGVSLRTVQLWVDGGLLEGWRTVGGHRRIRVASVERLMQERSLERPHAGGDGSGNAITMLVVEDDADLLELYRATIDTWQLPIELHTATDGFEGLIKIGQLAPDLLVTDLVMPGLDGFRMLRSLREHDGAATMTVVVVTGLDGDEMRAHGGVPANIPVWGKPVPFAQLRAIAEQLLAARKLQRGRGAAT